MADNGMNIEEMLTTIEKMLKNCKTKMNSAVDYETLNNNYQNGLGICNAAGNLKIVDKKKYDELVGGLKEILKSKIISIFNVDLDISDRIGLNCSVRIDNENELKTVYEVLKVTSRLKETYDIINMKDFPYVVNIDNELSEFVGTTKDFNAILELSKNRIILPFSTIYKK